MRKGIKTLLFAAASLFSALPLLAAQNETDRYHIRGKIAMEGKPLANVAVGIRAINVTTFTNENGEYDLYPVKRGQYDLALSHPSAKTVELQVFVKRDFRIDGTLHREITAFRSLPAAPPFFAATSSSYDSAASVSKAVTVFGLSPQYYTFLPSVSKMGVLFEPPVVRAQNPMNNSYVTDGLVLDMPFHSLGIYSTTNLRQVESVSVHRGVFSVTERDAQGAAMIETQLPAGREGRNGFDLYATPLIADVSGHYQISDKASGTVSIRRTIIDLYVASDTSTVPAPIDYQNKNVWRIDKTSQLEVVALGASDVIPLSGTQTFGSTAHAQKVKYARRDGQLVYSLDIRNRYFRRDVIVLSEKKQITSIHPQLGVYLAKEQYVAFGADLFYEGRSAALAQSQGISGINVDQLKGYTGGAYDSGNGLNFGGFASYRGRFGRFGAEASMRLDKYREYDSPYLASAMQLHFAFTPQAKIYAGAANMHRRGEPYKSLALLASPALAPESNYKAETGVSFSPLRFLKLQTTVFYTRWNNLITLRSDTASTAEISSTNLYRNAGSSENTGMETAAILQLGNFYVRSAYTYQYMPGGDNYSFYFRRHIWNSAFIHATEKMSHTVQLKVWSLPTDIDAAKSDALNPVVQLDYRWSIMSDSGFYFTAEIGQILNLPWRELAIPRRSEYNDTAALGNSLLGTPTKATAGDELPIHINLAAGVRL